ncbi:hypothetical protein AAFF_G00378780 [Aldrovandia affinis]|uniref:Matrin-type domain-containing protein n=1 Tax=Aldrovandia affinis TaxID=143900 RepID=A0AAD7WLM1_9TELE|nr:hypothetical protein AAFF_G00378780 [Aldrovandia affinis]
MFNHHHHQQQQLHQHLRQLQQLFQQQHQQQHQHQQPPPPAPPPSQPPSSHQLARHHHHHHHQGSRPIPAVAQAPHPAHMISMCSTSQATIMAANPMLQGALLMQQMQGNLQGFAVRGQQFAQFFSARSRSSLLGPAPMGVAINSPHMRVPPRHFHSHTRHYNQDLAARQPDRKRDNELRPAGGVDGQSEDKNTEGKENDRVVSTEGTAATEGHGLPSAQVQEEPALKRPRTEGSEILMLEPSEPHGALSSDYKACAEDKELEDVVILEEGGSMAGPETIECMEESRASEMVGVGATLKVTIQHSSESRAFSTGLEEQAGTGQGEARDMDGDTTNKFFCYICSTTCHNQQNFQSHMNGLAHQQRMMEIQHMSNACLVTLLPRVRETLESTHRHGEKRPGQQQWCATCQTHFSGDLIQHRRTKEHKQSKHSSRPFCTVCKHHFRTPRKFVEHMKSPDHKQRVVELREEDLPEVMEELITVDAVGCFEGEEDYEEEPNQEEEEEQGHSNNQGGQTDHKEVALEDMGDNEEYDPDTQYGCSFVVPVAGFLCRLCHKFYHFESTARLSHCQSLTHFQNLQKYKALRSQEDTSVPETCSSGVDTRDPKEMHRGDSEVEEKETEEEEGTEDCTTPSPPSLHRQLATPSPPTRGRAMRSHDLSVTISRPTAAGEWAPGDPLPGSSDIPEEGSLPVTHITACPPSSSHPLHRDFPGWDSGRRAIPGQPDPLRENREEEPAPGEQEEEEELEKNDAVITVEGKPATGCKRVASRRSARTTRRR